MIFTARRKVIFSEAFVSHSVQGQGVCIQGDPGLDPGNGSAFKGEGVVGHPPTGTRKVGGTHPTGMLVLQFTYTVIVFPENIFVKVK